MDARMNHSAWPAAPAYSPETALAWLNIKTDLGRSAMIKTYGGPQPEAATDLLRDWALLHNAAREIARGVPASLDTSLLNRYLPKLSAAHNDIIWEGDPAARPLADMAFFLWDASRKGDQPRLGYCSVGICHQPFYFITGDNEPADRCPNHR